jgi:hypothetical protein
MRKFVIAALGLLATLAMAAAVAQGDPASSPGGMTQTLDIKQSSTKPKKGYKVTVTLSISCAPDKQCQAPPAPIGKPSPVFNTVVNLPKGTKLGYKSFPTCDPKKLEKSGLKGCSSKARVGKGTLTADGRPVVEAPVQGTVTAFNGTNKRYLLYVIPELSSPLVLVGKLSGSKLSIPVPPVPTLPGQPNATLTKFQVNTGGTAKKKRKGKTKKYNYLQNPRKCPKGGYLWKFDFTYENGEKLSPTDAVKC